ncbi:hypothetical protein ACLB3A_10785 [Corynebacterium freneyi]|uniref:hypothetical protein n=1 Tax=Corynebacterium freneyi TaxID=134034 RepID=UPI00254AE000|nr:hypothetical protein [Corynebacterium freneyi]MDK8767812.1 hypothetical protein [Corynebacterium freneyi]
MKKFTRAAAAAAIAAGMAIGVASPASAQINPVLPDFGSLMPRMGESSAPKVRLGQAGGPAWKGEMFKQVTRGATVTPGGLVTTRIEIRGLTGKGEKVRELADIMPAGFELVSVTRMKENALGEAIYNVPAGEYTVVPVDNGMQEVHISWKEGGFLGAFQDNPTVSPSKSVVVDFTYRAPKELGQYQHGGYFHMGAVINPTFRTETGGTPITVENSLPAAFGSLGSS